MKIFVALSLCAVTLHAQISGSYDELLAKAHAGDGNAAYSLGKLYEKPGKGKVPDFSGAAYWYTQASRQNISAAMTDLANFYLTGTGVPRDDAKAFELFESAAKAGYARAMTRLGEAMIASNYYGAGKHYGRPWIEKAAEAGEPDALNDLGSLILGERPTGKAPKIREALPVFQQAAEHGSCMAMFNIGNLYLHGSYEFKFAQEPAEALRWFEKVKTCRGAAPDVVQQATELAQRTAKGELPPLSRQQVMVSGAQNVQQGTTSAESVVVKVFAALTLVNLLFGSNGGTNSSGSTEQPEPCTIIYQTRRVWVTDPVSIDTGSFPGHYETETVSRTPGTPCVATLP